MKFMIAGLGSIGRRHLRNLLVLGERDIVLYRTHKGTLDDDNFSDFPVETNLEAALAHRPNAVIVSNPTALHLQVAIPAAEAGCHVLLEKPVSHSMDKVEDLQRAVRVGGGKVLVGYQFRFHPGLQKVSALLSDSAIGRSLSIHAHWGEYLPDWHPWEDYRLGYSARKDLGGGVILTLSHPLDYLRWLVGDVEALWAFTGYQSELELEVEDTAEIGMKFRNRTIGNVYLDYNQQPPAHWLEIVGTEGTIRWDNADGSVRLYQVSKDQWATFPLPPDFERNDLFLAEMRHFLDIVRHNTQPVCTLEDGIQALRLAQAAHESAEYGQLVILQ